MSITTHEDFRHTSQNLDGKDSFTGNALYSFPMSAWGIMNEAYIAGRTAEPTEAEIEAAAIAAYKYYFDSRGNTITLEIAKHDVQRFNGSTDEFSDPDVNYARNIATVVLTAARKAVTA